MKHQCGFVRDLAWTVGGYCVFSITSAHIFSSREIIFDSAQAIA